MTWRWFRRFTSNFEVDQVEQFFEDFKFPNAAVNHFIFVCFLLSGPTGWTALLAGDICNINQICNFFTTETEPLWLGILKLQTASTEEISKYVPFLQKPVIHCPLIRPFMLKSKLALWVTRGCAWIHVGHSVSKLAGLRAHNGYQNSNMVVLHGKTAYVGLHPLLLDRFTLFCLQWYLFVTRTPYHQKSCDLEWWVACCEDFVVKSGVHATGN